MKLGIMFRNFGPYHAARVDAVKNVCATSALEIARYDIEYNWERDENNCPQVYSLAELYPRARRDRYCAITKIKTWLNENQPDVLAVPGWSEPLALASTLEARRVSIPVVLMSDSRPLVYAKSGPRSRAAVVEYFKKQIIGLFNSALVAGREQSSYLESLGMPHSKISLGFDVVDNKHFSLGAAHARKNSEFLRRRLGLPARYFLLCNRLVPVKNIETVIVAFASFHKNKAAEGWQLIIAGHGRMREMLVQFAQERGVLNDIQFRGAETYEQLPVLYGLAEAFILPSWSETWGLVVNEAMAAGLPVIVSTHVGCVHELVQHGSNGYIFNPNDADRLSELMLGLAKNDRLRAEMRRCSERIISDWDLSRFVEGILLAATNATSDPVSPATRTGLSMAAGLIWR